MKASTLTQPWATLVALGVKRIETRSWGTRYRGPLAIHAAKGLGPVGGLEGLKDLCQTPPFCDALVQSGIAFAGELPLGAVVAIATLADCIEVGTGTAAHLNLSARERAFGDFTPGRFAWVLGAAIALSAPIPARGTLGLWEWDAPAEVLALLRGG